MNESKEGKNLSREKKRRKKEEKMDSE